MGHKPRGGTRGQCPNLDHHGDSLGLWAELTAAHSKLKTITFTYIGVRGDQGEGSTKERLRPLRDVYRTNTVSLWYSEM